MPYTPCHNLHCYCFIIEEPIEEHRGKPAFPDVEGPHQAVLIDTGLVALEAKEFC
jgi:hypothetical protein